MNYSILLLLLLFISRRSYSKKLTSHADIINKNIQRSLLSLSSLSSLIIVNNKKVNAITSSIIPSASILDDIQYKKSLFNLPPKEMTYPSYFEGEWNVDYTFDGAGFTNKIPFDQIAKDPNIAGFRKYSVAFMSDIGKDTHYNMRYKKRNDGMIVEDLEYNLQQCIEIQLKNSNCKVSDFVYDPSKNPNRAGFKYSDDKGNGIIEIFVNDRKKKESDNKFYSLTNLRQSSVRRREDIISSNGGVRYAASQILCDYAIELNLNHSEDNKIEGLFRIFSYLNPQDSNYFIAQDIPVALFQYKVTFKR